MKIKIAMAGSVVTLIILLFQLVGERRGEAASTLTLFCAASNRAVIDCIIQDYHDEFGVDVVVQYGPSQTLLSSIEISRTGDLYLPADESYLEMADAKGLIESTTPLATMRVGLAVQKQRPIEVTSMTGLLDQGLKIIQADPNTAAVGKLTKLALTKQGLWNKVSRVTTTFRTTVTDVANDVKLGTADVGIVFDVVLATYPDLLFVEIDELKQSQSRVAVGLLKSATNPALSGHFARYLAAKDRGLRRYREAGYNVVDGRPWERVPAINERKSQNTL